MGKGGRESISCSLRNAGNKLKKTPTKHNTTQQEEQKNRGKEHNVVLFLLISKFTYFLLKGEEKVSMVTVLTRLMRGYREHLALKDMNTLGMRFSFCCRFIFPMPYDSDRLFLPSS